MPKLYTKTGDDGTTGLLHARVPKDDPRLLVLNQADLLSVNLGLVLYHAPQTAEFITRLQSFLIDLGSAVAGKAPDEADAQVLVAELEVDIDRLDAERPPLKNFILPQGNLAGLHAHQARVSCRQLEMMLVAIEFRGPQSRIAINRLSDWLFALARVLTGADIAYKKSVGTFSVV